MGEADETSEGSEGERALEGHAPERARERGEGGAERDDGAERDEDEPDGDEPDGDEPDGDEPDESAPHACPRHPDVRARGACERCGSYFCDACLRAADRPLDASRCPQCAPEPPAARTVGGWLVLPAIGLVVTFANVLRVALTDLAAFDTQVPELVPLLIEETVLYVGMAGLTAYAAFLFFQKKKRAVPWMIGYYVAGVLLALFDLYAASSVEDILGVAQPVDGAHAARGFLAPFIWIAYFTNSQRVRETFVLD